MLIYADKERYAEYMMNQYKANLRMNTPDSILPVWLKSDPFGDEEPFENPREMWDAAQNYFNWAEGCPVEEDTTKRQRGITVVGTSLSPRAFSMRAFATFCGCSIKQVEAYRNKPEYERVMAVIDQIIYTQKFEFAAVNIMNPGLIARDLQISENLDIGGRGNPIQTLNVAKLSTQALEELLNAQVKDDE